MRWLFATTLVLLMSPAAARADADFQLANGLRVTLIEDAAAARAAVWLSFAVGSADEGEEPRGIAHLAEHLYVRGPAGQPRFAVRAARIGGDGVNAGTDFDRTNFYWTVPSEALTEALVLEAERLRRPRAALTGRTLAGERRIVLAEMREGAGSLDTVVKRAVFPVIYGASHPHASLPEGTASDLARIDQRMIGRWLDRWYRPSNARLIIVGAFDADQLEALVRIRFAEAPAAYHVELQPVSMPMTAATETSRTPVKVEAGVQSVTLYGVAPGSDHGESVALQRAVQASQSLFADAVRQRFGEQARGALWYRPSRRTGNVGARVTFDGAAEPMEIARIMREWLASARPDLEYAATPAASPLDPPAGTPLARAYAALVDQNERARRFGGVTEVEMETAFRRWFTSDLIEIHSAVRPRDARAPMTVVDDGKLLVRVGPYDNPDLAKVEMSWSDGRPADPVCARALDRHELASQARAVLLDRFREKLGWTYNVHLNEPLAAERPGVRLSFLVPASRASEAAREAARLVLRLMAVRCGGLR